MTLRYATLASPALRSAYDQAIGKVRKMLPIAPARQPAVPAKVDWIASEFLKTRVAHGYCSRHLAAGACPYANICETCNNFVPGQEHLPVLRDQLSDIRQLRADAEQRGWDGEVKRHGRVISALDRSCGLAGPPGPSAWPVASRPSRISVRWSATWAGSPGPPPEVRALLRRLTGGPQRASQAASGLAGGCGRGQLPTSGSPS